MSISPLTAPLRQATETFHEQGAAPATNVLLRFQAPITLGLLIIAIAAAVRLTQLGQPSLTAHEAHQANWVIQDRTEAMRSLPPLVGWMHQTSTAFLGKTEFVLRLPSALAGLLCVALVFEFCRRRIDPLAGVLAAGIATVHPVLLTTSRSVGLGSIEAMFAVALLWSGRDVVAEPSRRRMATFTAVAMLALACTFTSVLLIAAWLPLMVWAAWRHRVTLDRPRQAWPGLLVMVTVVGASCWGWFSWFAGHVDLNLMPRAQEVPFRILPAGSALAELASWLIDGSFGMVGFARDGLWLSKPISTLVVGFSILALACSLRVLWKCHRSLLAFGCLLLLVMGAVMGMDHPLSEMLSSLVFVYPLVSIGVGVGLMVLIGRLKRTLVGALAILVCLGLPGQKVVRATAMDLATPMHVRPILEYIASHKEPDDAIFVWHQATEAFTFSWPDPSTAVYLQPPEEKGIHLQFRRGNFIKQIDAYIAEQGRVWLVFAHCHDERRLSYLALLRQYVTDFGVFEQSDEYCHADACALLLDDGVS